MDILRLANNTVPSGNQVTNTTAKTYLADSVRRAADTVSGGDAGHLYEIEVFGYVSSAAASPGTLALRIELGTTVLGAATFTLPASLANAGVYLKSAVVVATPGSSGKVACQGFAMIDNVGACISAGLVNAGTGATGQVTVNTFTAALLQVSAQFSAASASNIFTATQIIVTEKT